MPKGYEKVGEVDGKRSPGNLDASTIARSGWEGEIELQKITSHDEQKEIVTAHVWYVWCGLE